MPYVPINVGAFTASFAGAIAGMAVSGWIVDPTSSDYQNATLIAGAFAQAFDIAWNNAAQLNNLEIEAMTSVIQQDFKDRGPGPFNNPRFQDPSNWTVPARACAALILQSDIYFTAQSINPGIPGGIAPPTISQQVFVAKWGNDITGNGTSTSPYLTINHALATITDAAVNKLYIVNIEQGTYTENLALKPFINIYGVFTDPGDDGAGPPPDTTGGTVLNGNLTLDASYSGAASTADVVNLDVTGTTILNYVGIGSADGLTQFFNCLLEGNITLTMSNGNFVALNSTTIVNNLTQVGGAVNAHNSNGVGLGLLLIQATATANVSSVWQGGSWFGNVTLDQNGSANTNQLELLGFSISGVVSKIATATHTPTIVSPVPISNENVVLTGAAAVLDPQMRISHQFTNVAPNPTAIAATSTTTITVSDATFTALFGGTSIESCHCEATLVGSTWQGVTAVKNCSITIVFENNLGTPTMLINIYNPGAGFNITDVLNVNVAAYLPSTL